MKHFLSLLCAIGCITFTSAAANERAIPDRFAKCTGFDAPDEAAGVYFSTDCTTAFVLPARTGSLKTQTILPSPYLDACGIRNAQIRAAEIEVEQALREAATAAPASEDRAHCPLIRPRATQLEDRISQVELENDAQVRQVAALEEQRELCLADRLDCTGVYSELDYAIRRQLSLEHRLTSTRRRLDALQDQYRECFADNTEAASTIEAVTAFDEINRISEALYLSQSILEGKEGDTISVLLSLEHSSLVRDAQRRNRDFIVLPAPIELGLTMDIASNSPIDFSAVQRSSIPLMQAPSSFFNQPAGDSSPDADVFVFGPTASGQVVLSLDGACSVRRQGIDERFLAGYISANVVFRMPIVISIEIEAEADFVELYSRIARQTTRGGFFRTSSSSSVVNSLRSDEVITVSVQDDGLLTPAELFELTATVKDRIIQRALDQVAREYLPNVPFVDVAPPGETGSDVASQGIRENCKAKWCQVAAVALDVGSAIFGGTDATQEFVRSRNINVQEIINVSTVYYTYGSIALIVQ